MSKAITHFLAAPTRHSAALLAAGALVLLLLLGVVSISTGADPNGVAI